MGSLSPKFHVVYNDCLKSVPNADTAGCNKPIVMTDAEKSLINKYRKILVGGTI